MTNVIYCNRCSIYGDHVKSDYFTMDELGSNSTDRLMNSKFMRYLGKVRKDFGLPMPVTSGFRTTEENYAVGGSSNSYHLYGCAVDISCENFTIGDVQRLIWYCGYYGLSVIVYDRHVHIDIRPTPCIFHGKYKQ